MAYITTTGTARAGTGFGGHFTTLFARWRAWRSYRATFNALSSLTDAELNDIGLTRGEIRSVSTRLR